MPFDISIFTELNDCFESSQNKAYKLDHHTLETLHLNPFNI